MKIKLGHIADEEYYAITEQGIRVDIDMLPSEEKKHMSPMQLLLSGVISCAAVDLVSMVKKRRKTLVEFSGEIEGVRRTEIPKKFTDIHIVYTFVSPDLGEEEAQKLVDLAVEKYCSVAASLDPAIKMTHGVKIVRPE